MRPLLADIQRALVAHEYNEQDPLVGWLASVPANARALDIHAAHCRENLVDALAAVHPVILALVGDACFRGLGRRYRTDYSSRCANIHAFGGALAAFLSTAPEVADLAYLPDVAGLEWAWHEAYHAPDDPPFDLAALMTVPAEAHGRLRFRLARHVRLLACRYPALRIWEAHQTGAIADAPVSVGDGSYRYVVLRAGGIPGVTEVDGADYALLTAFAAGAPLMEALGGSSAPVEALGRWLAAGAVVGFGEDA